MNYEPILTKLSINALNTMQLQAIQSICDNADTVLLSPTGTGKTLGFLLPILQLIDKDKTETQVLIIVPSRELAIQIESVFKKMNTGIKINAAYGGHLVKTETHNFTEPPLVLVGTPGRIAHHIRNNNISTKGIKTLILDEFDKSLEAGFDTEMEYIIKECIGLTKRVLTSATALKDIPKFVGVKKPTYLNFISEETRSASNVIIKQVRVAGDDKLEALLLLIGKVGEQSTLVFCNHREAVNRIAEQLSFYKIEYGVYHGGLDQAEREKTLIKLRNGTIRLLLTTDLAARGLDIPEIETVIHYQLPNTEDTMIHRNGRTARMNATGTVYFLLDKTDELPPFLTTEPIEEFLPKKLTVPSLSNWKTLYIAAGKKDKVNKMDIVGMLLQKAGLQKEDLGKIEVLDFSAYVAVKKDKINQAVKNSKDEKIKNKKVKIEASH